MRVGVPTFDHSMTDYFPAIRTSGASTDETYRGCLQSIW
jgi:hypothetical protein